MLKLNQQQDLEEITKRYKSEVTGFVYNLRPIIYNELDVEAISLYN